jgi:uncharacterized protein (DUF58 family)
MPYLSKRFFYLFGSITVLFAAAYAAPILLPMAKMTFFLAVALVLADASMLYLGGLNVTCTRTTSSKWSLSDPNPVALDLYNPSRFYLYYVLHDELPAQLQRRDHTMEGALAPDRHQHLTYDIRPFTRGVYEFGYVQIFVSTALGLLERRLERAEPEEVAVYPSIIQMKAYELRAMKHIAQDSGIKKIRRVGHSYEFEQVKNYVEGDDYRSINWKASSRRHTLMVNQYEDERSQQVYCLIDKSRSMLMPFGGMSLLDYSINTTLAMSNIILKKQDKAGLLSFSDVIGATHKAERDHGQLRRITESLYRERERPVESNFELLYEAVRRLVTGRSLLLLFTNFESKYALDRAMPTLRRLQANHLLVVIFFDNTEIRQLSQRPVERTLDIFEQTAARQFLHERKEMAARLRQYGIQSILTRPEDLTIHTINKYLELKSRGMV